jgi:hypothetical protein
MATSRNMSSDRQGATGVQLGISEALLRSEVEFWCELIESCEENESPDSLERMRYAMALAESRLASVLEPDRKTSTKPTRLSNVILLDEAREPLK